MSNVLVVVSHPDDEVLGCGGTIASHVDAGDHVTVVLFCENTSLRYGASVDMKAQTRGAKLILGYQNLIEFEFPDQKLDEQPFLRLTSMLERVWGEVDPYDVYTHWSGDLNRDHRIVNEVVQVVSRPKMWKPVDIVECYIPSSTEMGTSDQFKPDTWKSLTADWVEKKMCAMAQYRSELGQVGGRSLRGVNTAMQFFGQQVGASYAEPFKTMRRIL